MEVKQITNIDIAQKEAEIENQIQKERKRLSEAHKEWIVNHSQKKLKEVRRIQAAIKEIDKHFGSKKASEISVADMNAFAIQTIAGTTLDDADLWSKASFAICCLDDLGEIDLSKITDFKAPGNWAVLTEGSSRRTLDQTTRITYDILRKLNAGNHPVAKKAFLDIESRSKVHKMLMQLTNEERSEFSETAIPRLMAKLSEIVGDQELETAIHKEAQKWNMSDVEWLKELMENISSVYNDQRWDSNTVQVEKRQNIKFMEEYELSRELIYNSALKHNKDIWLIDGSDIEYAESCIGIQLAYTGETKKINVDLTKLPSVSMSFLLQIALAFSLKTNDTPCLPGMFNIENLKDIRNSHDHASLMEILEREPAANFSTPAVYRKYKVVNLLRGAPGLYCPLLKDLKIALTGSLAIEYQNERDEKKWRTVQCFLPRAEEVSFDKPLINDEEYLSDLNRFKEILSERDRANDYIATAKIKEEDIGVPRSVINWKVNRIVKEIIDGLNPSILNPAYDAPKFSAYYDDCSLNKKEDDTEVLKITGNYVLRNDYLIFLKENHHDVYELILKENNHLITGAQFTQTVPVSDVREDSTWEFDVRNHMLKSMVPIPFGYSVSGRCTSQGMVVGDNSPNGSQLYRIQYRIKVKSEPSTILEKKSEIGSVVDTSKKIPAQGVMFYVQPDPFQAVYNVTIRDHEIVSQEESDKVCNYINKLTNQELRKHDKGKTSWNRFGGSYIANTNKCHFNTYLYLKPGFEERLEDNVYYLDKEEQMYNSSWFNLTMSTKYCDAKSPFQSSVTSFYCYVTMGMKTICISLYGKDEVPPVGGLSYIISRTHCITVSEQTGYIRLIPKDAGNHSYMEFCERLPYIKAICTCKIPAQASSLKIDNRSNNVETFRVFLSPVTGKKIIPMRCYRSVYFTSKHSRLGRIREIVPSISDFLGVKEVSGRIMVPIDHFNREEDLHDGDVVINGIVYHPIRINCEGDTVFDMKHSSCQSTFEWFGAKGETNRVSLNPTDGQITIGGTTWYIEVKCSQSLNRAVTNMMAPPYINTLLIGMSYESVIYSPELEPMLKQCWPCDKRITNMDAMLAIAIAWSKFQVENAGFSFVSRNKLPLKNEYSDKVTQVGEKSLRDKRIEQLLNRADPTGKKDRSVAGIVSKENHVKPSVDILHTEGDPDVWFKHLIREPARVTLEELKTFHYECPEGREEEDLTTANRENLKRLKSVSRELNGVGLKHFLNVPVRYDSIPRGGPEMDQTLMIVLNQIGAILEDVYRERKSHKKAAWNKVKSEVWGVLSSMFSGKEIEMKLPFGSFKFPSKMVDSQVYDWIMCMLSAFEESDQSFSITENKIPNGIIDNVHQEEGVKFKGAMLMKIQRPIQRSTIDNDAQSLMKLINSGLRCSQINETQPQRYFNQVLGLGLFAPDTETMNKMIKKDAACASKIEEYKRRFASTAEGGDQLLGIKVRETLESVWFANLHNDTRSKLVSKGHAMLEAVNQAMKAFMNDERTPLEIDNKVRELANLEASSSIVQRSLQTIGRRLIAQTRTTHFHKTTPLSKQEVNVLLKKLSDLNNE